MEVNLFFDPKGYALLSQTAKYYIGGLLKHAEALCAICSPSTNSYKRLVPGFEAPVNLVYSARNRSAAVRIPMYSDNPKAKRIEFRPPDATSNSYLCLSALLMAGLDGIVNKIDPGQPFDKDTYTLSAKEAKKLKTVPGSLEQAINALEKDHKFLPERRNLWSFSRALIACSSEPGTVFSLFDSLALRVKVSLSNGWPGSILFSMPSRPAISSADRHR